MRDLSSTQVISSNVDSLTGDSTVVVDGIIGILDIQRDPFGNFLFSDSSGNFGMLLVETNAVPEPSSLVLLGLGVVGLVARRRR